MTGILQNIKTNGKKVLQELEDKIKHQTAKLEKIIRNQGKDIMVDKGEYSNGVAKIYTEYEVINANYTSDSEYDIKVEIKHSGGFNTEFYLNDSTKLTIISSIEKL